MQDDIGWTDFIPYTDFSLRTITHPKLFMAVYHFGYGIKKCGKEAVAAFFRLAQQPGYINVNCHTDDVFYVIEVMGQVFGALPGLHVDQFELHNLFLLK